MAAAAGGYRGPDRRPRTESQSRASRPGMALLALVVLALVVGLGATSSLRVMSAFLSVRAPADLMLPLQAAGLLRYLDPVLQQLAPACVLVLGVTGAYLCIRATRLRSPTWPGCRRSMAARWTPPRCCTPCRRTRPGTPATGRSR